MLPPACNGGLLALACAHRSALGHQDGPQGEPNSDPITVPQGLRMRGPSSAHTGVRTSPIRSTRRCAVVAAGREMTLVAKGRSIRPVGTRRQAVKTTRSPG